MSELLFALVIIGGCAMVAYVVTSAIVTVLAAFGLVYSEQREARRYATEPAPTFASPQPAPGAAWIARHRVTAR